MTTSRLGQLDPKWMRVMLHKPAQAVMMSFSADPNLGMVTDRFTGHAVVFVATATFTPPTRCRCGKLTSRSKTRRHARARPAHP